MTTGELFFFFFFFIFLYLQKIEGKKENDKKLFILKLICKGPFILVNLYFMHDLILAVIVFF